MVKATDALKKIKEVRPYVDRINIKFKRKPSQLDINELRSKCKGNVDERGVTPYTDKTGLRRLNYLYLYTLDICQPSTDALSYLLKVSEGISTIISYIELALDFLARSKDDVPIIRRFFNQCWVKKWNKAKWLSCGESDTDDTTYYARQGSSVNFAIYSDGKAFQKHGKPCCHLEVRISGSKIVRNKKIVGIRDIIEPSIQRKFWEKYLTLLTVPDVALLEGICFRTIQAKMPNGDPIMGLHIYKKLFCLGGAIRAQNIIHFGKFFDARRRLLVRIPNKLFLKKIKNARGKKLERVGLLHGRKV